MKRQRLLHWRGGGSVGGGGLVAGGGMKGPLRRGVGKIRGLGWVAVLHVKGNLKEEDQEEEEEETGDDSASASVSYRILPLGV